MDWHPLRDFLDGNFVEPKSSFWTEVGKEKKLKQNEIKLADKEIYDNESEDEMTPEEIEDMMNASTITQLSPIIVKNKKKNK